MLIPPIRATAMIVTSSESISACLRSMSLPPMTVTVINWSPIRQRPFFSTPPIIETTQRVGFRRLGPGSDDTVERVATSGMSAVSLVNSARVVASYASPIRSSSSASVSRPSEACSDSRWTTCSRSASDARMPGTMDGCGLTCFAASDEGCRGSSDDTGGSADTRSGYPAYLQALDPGDHVGCTDRCGRRSLRRGEVEHPVLPDEVVAETVVLLLLDQLEPGPLVDAPRRHEHVVRPEHQRSVAGGPGEPDALVDQPRADSRTARRRLDQKQPQLSCHRVLGYAEHAPNRRR